MDDLVAVLGGTFDPIHNGHVSVLQQVSEHLSAKQVWLLVAGHPYLHGRSASAVELRLQMAEAVARTYGWRVCDVEARRAGPTYTIDTVIELHGAYPELGFRYVIGADAARHIQQWHRWQELLEQTNTVLINRTGVDPISLADAEQLGFKSELTTVLEVESPPVSATAVRDRVRDGQSIADMVPPAVSELIAELHVYG